MMAKLSRNSCLANDNHSYCAMLVREDTMIHHDTMIYLVVKSLVDCLQLQQDLLSLETGNQIEKWISVPLNVEKERKKNSISFSTLPRADEISSYLPVYGNVYFQYILKQWIVFFAGVDKSRNMEHSGTCRNIPEDHGT